jgi:hypothetical protein
VKSFAQNWRTLRPEGADTTSESSHSVELKHVTNHNKSRPSRTTDTSCFGLGLVASFSAFLRVLSRYANYKKSCCVDIESHCVAEEFFSESCFSVWLIIVDTFYAIVRDACRSDTDSCPLSLWDVRRREHIAFSIKHSKFMPAQS